MNTIYFHSPIGPIKVTATPDAITELIFTDSIDSTQDANNLLVECRKQLGEYFAHKRKEFTLPVEQSGTAFQQSVWEELQQIPYGETRSYLGLAKALGNEKAVRAVGAANGRNKIALLVPCHRVIGSSGEFIGFAYGKERKRFLLDLEKGFSTPSLF